MNFKRIIFIASIFGLLAVVLGAFGAHGLKEVLSDEKMVSYKTGISYQFYHTFALLITALLMKISPSKWFRWSSVCFILGILFFSGSIYLLACRELIGLTNYRWLGPITPIGGLLFIAGWGLMSFGAIKNTDS